MFHWTIHVKGEHRKGQAAVVVGHKLYCFGGYGNLEKQDHIEVEVFNTVSLCWRRTTPVTAGRGEHHLEVPSRRYGHTAVLIGDTVYVWGGFPFCNVLYAFDVDAHKWFKPEVSGTVPEERRDHSACVLGKVMFIHGGRNHHHRATNDIYKLDTTTMVWALINTRGPPPPDSSHHSATIIGTKMFVFGGCRGWRDQCYDTIRVFDTDTDCWLNTPSTQIRPKRRCSHSAFTYNGELYIYGGWNNAEYVNDDDELFNDLWKYNPETFSWKKVEPKGKQSGPMRRRFCCMVGDRIFLFGGDTTPDDLYVLDFSPSLKTLCKLAVIQYGLQQSELPHDIRWELRAMTTNNN